VVEALGSLPFYVPVTLDPWESYGLIGLQLVRHLARLGVEVDLYGPSPQMARAHADTPAGGIVLGPVDTFAYHGQRLRQGPHVAITMFESTRLPADAQGSEDDWVTPLNACDAVIVPSRFCAEVFVGSGVHAPIHVVPLGIGDIYRYQERPEKPQGMPCKGLTFLTFIDRGERKGGHMALQAFLRAFGDDPRYKLILKSRKPRTGLNFTNPNIETIQADLSEAELYQLYLRADVLINAHCGEGFGLLPREFAASGGLALTTAWSGTADELERWGVALPYTLVKAGWRDTPKYAGKELGEWAQVDTGELAQVLREVASDWESYAKTLAAKAQAARQLYSWHEFASGVLNVWKEAAYAESRI
jgi:hypothetical protein